MGRKKQGFQPTLPVRGATSTRSPHPARMPYFNPRSPCGERPSCSRCRLFSSLFQPTLPVRGATLASYHARRSACAFQPTLPVRGATLHLVLALSCILYFNPRSPCGERPGPGMMYCIYLHFNPRSPCGERLPVVDTNCFVVKFQPTLPVRGATSTLQRAVAWLTISTHAPRAGSDRQALELAKHQHGFQPTLPVRGATRLG